MQRTQVYLEQPEYEALRLEAFKTKKTMSAVLRQLLKKEFNIKKTKAPKTQSGKFMLGLAEKYGFEGPKDLSSNLDTYLYGKRASKEKKNEEQQ